MRFLAVFPLLLAAGCSSENEAGRNAAAQAVDINAAAAQAQDTVNAYANSIAEDAATEAPAAVGARPDAVAPLAPPAPGTPGGLPDDRTPVSEAPFTADSAQGAANVVQTYYALLGEGEYRRAWALWDDGGKASGMSPEEFAASFARYSEYHANIGAPGDIDAGAGQRYVTVPVQVYGRLKQGGRPVYMIGSVTLHRVGDIDGASAAQKSWHIRSADIKPRPGDTAAAAAAAAPATPATPVLVAASYRCSDGTRIEVDFDNRADTATIRSRGKPVAMLSGMRPASGIWYSGHGYELRGKGKAATFSQPGLTPLACVAR